MIDKFNSLIADLKLHWKVEDVLPHVLPAGGIGGPYGIALLAAYCVNKVPQQSLEEYLSVNVFNMLKEQRLSPKMRILMVLMLILSNTKKLLAVEKAAIKNL